MKLLLSILAALACLCWGAAAPASVLLPVPTPVPIAAAQTIYAGSFQNNWQNWSWAQTVAGTPAPALSSGSLAVQAQGWQAVYLHHSALRTTPLSALSFWVNGGPTGGQSLVVRALRSGVPQASVTLGALRANAWQQVQIALPKLGVGAVSDLDGFWIQNNTPDTAAAFYVDKVALSLNGGLPPVLPPSTPGGLTATAKWEPSCPFCGGMAMAHIVLAWNTVTGAASYTVYRDGVKQTSVTTPGWTDMGVTSGQTYSYAVSATGVGGESALSAPASATAPQPPASAAGVMTAPVNLSVHGLWSGGPADTLTWSPVPGAASYNVYQYGMEIASVTSGSTFAVPVSAWQQDMSYFVTAVDPMGMESLPSALAVAQGGLDPANPPGWSPNAPAVPAALTATPEWNAGRPRIHLAWRGLDTDETYTVYRDGQALLSGLWGLNAYDVAVTPGETHTYAVTGSNVVWTRTLESAASLPVSATALTAAPAPAAALSVQVTSVVPGDDSVLVSFAAVPGAADYRVYDTAHPATVKYSGGSLSIQMNGLDPAGATLVVEAVDKLGPFQTMDGMAGPGAMQMDGMHEAINGQGDPSNVPVVLASSVPFAVSPEPETLAGSQTFFDTFRGEQPLAALPLPALQPGTFYGDPNQYGAYANDKWTVRNYGGDLKNTKIFFMGSHFMDTLYDGGTPGTNQPLHNNNASLVMMPNAVADISGGKVLHVTFEVDAHMDGRRWCDVFVGAAGDTLVDPGKFSDFSGRRPTLSGKLFRWEIHNDAHSMEVFPGVQPDAQSDAVYLTHQESGVGPDSFGICARSGAWCAVPFNGTAGDLDKRHRFDLYLSQTRAVVMEQGLVVKDASFPAGVTLPFSRCQVYFVHQLYHTANDRPELLDYDPADSYWINNRPHADERHWDNMGFSVLDAFPALP